MDGVFLNGDCPELMLSAVQCRADIEQVSWLVLARVDTFCRVLNAICFSLFSLRSCGPVWRRACIPVPVR